MEGISNRRLFIGVGLLLGCCLICLAIATLSISRNLTVFIEPDERGVVISPSRSQGVQQETLEPGWHLIPSYARVEIYNIGQQVYPTSQPDLTEVRTLDGETVFVNIFVTYSLDPRHILDIHNNWQDRYDDDLVRPQTKSVTRKTISLYGINELRTQLPEIEQSIFEELEKQLSEHGLILLKVSLQPIQ